MKIQNIKQQGLFIQVFNGSAIGIGLTVESAIRDAEKNAEVLECDRNGREFLQNYALN